MILSDVSIKRSVFATMLNMVLIVFGIFSFIRIGIDLLPNVDFPFVTVQVVYPGADPRTVEDKVLDPLEKGLNGLEGLDHIESYASPNYGIVVLQFKLERDGNKAAQDVRDKISILQSQLPTDSKAPIVQKFDIGSQPVFNLIVSGKKIKYAELSRLAKDVVKPSIEQVPGVGSVGLIGQRDRQMIIHINREALQSFGLSPTQIVQAIQAQNIDIPGGKIENQTNLVRIRTEGLAKTPDEIRKIMIPLKNGQKIRVDDVANVEDTLQEEETYASFSGNQAIAMQIFKQSGGNTVAIAKEAKDKVIKLQKDLPEGVTLDITNDTSIYIKGSIDSVRLDLMLGAILAVIIVLFFLHDWRATIISGLAIPTAVIGTFAFISFFGFTLNVLTTLALTLSIGILVDDAIVVIENIYRHIEDGENPIDAAKNGTAEIGLAVFAITLSIVSVFVPVAFMEGIIGRFFYSFGITVAVAVLLSLFVAFTLTPMLSSKILRSHKGHIHPFFKPIAKFLDNLDMGYKKILAFCLNNRWKTIGLGIVIFILSIFLLKFVPVTFFPKEDTSQFSVRYELTEGSSLNLTKERALKLDDALRKYPGVKSTVLTIGGGNDKKPNYASIDVNLVDTEFRDFNQEQLMQKMRDELSKTYKSNDEIFEISTRGGAGGGKTISFVVTGQDMDNVIKYANDVKKYIIENVKDSVDVSTSEPPRSKEIKVDIDHVKAADVGLNTMQIGMTIRNLFEGTKIGDINDGTQIYDLQLKLDNSDTVSSNSLVGLNILNNQGLPIALSSVAKIDMGYAPAKIERYNGSKKITVGSNFTGKDLSSAVKQIEDYVTKTKPENVNFKAVGQAEIMKDSINSVLQTLLLAILLIYMVLCAQFESYLIPFVIMMSVPLSFSGAFAGLLISGREISMYTMIGLILLMGLVTKNAILLIDFALNKINAGMSTYNALLEAGPMRLRPILMTTFAMILGMTPIAIGHGVGGEARSPMAIAVIGGLVSSTLLTLIVIPCIFSLIEDFRGKLAKRKIKH